MERCNCKSIWDEKKSLHYTEIATMIAERGYRTSLGATAQDTVSTCITTDINSNKLKSIFVRVDRGEYILRKFFDERSELLGEEAEIISEKLPIKLERVKTINAFGIYWNRNLVHWKIFRMATIHSSALLYSTAFNKLAFIPAARCKTFKPPGKRPGV